jgi:hypothetical protein
VLVVSPSTVENGAFSAIQASMATLHYQKETLLTRVQQMQQECIIPDDLDEELLIWESLVPKNFKSSHFPIFGG